MASAGQVFEMQSAMRKPLRYLITITLLAVLSGCLPCRVASPLAANGRSGTVEETSRGSVYLAREVVSADTWDASLRNELLRHFEYFADSRAARFAFAHLVLSSSENNSPHFADVFVFRGHARARIAINGKLEELQVAGTDDPRRFPVKGSGGFIARIENKMGRGGPTDGHIEFFVGVSEQIAIEKAKQVSESLGTLADFPGPVWVTFVPLGRSPIERPEFWPTRAKLLEPGLISCAHEAKETSCRVTPDRRHQASGHEDAFGR